MVKMICHSFKLRYFTFCCYHDFEDLASIKDAFFALCILHLLVFKKLIKLEDGYLHNYFKFDVRLYFRRRGGVPPMYSHLPGGASIPAKRGP